MVLIFGFWFMMPKLSLYASSPRNYQDLYYGRIHLLLNKESPIDSKKKQCIDSIFTKSERILRDFELKLGYKLTSDVELMLFENASLYQEFLSRSEFCAGRLENSNMRAAGKIFPLFINVSLWEIDYQLRYGISQVVLSEFIFGNNIRQRLSQNVAMDIPLWFSIGLSAYYANGWDAQSAEIFSYYESLGHFKKLGNIPNVSAQMFGRKIWKELITLYGKSAINSMWFVAKYTKNIDAAFIFQTGVGMKNWLVERSTNIFPKTQYQNKIQIENNKAIKLPIREIYCNKALKSIVIEWFSPGEVYYSWYDFQSSKSITLIRQPCLQLLDGLNIQSIKYVGEMQMNQTKCFIFIQQSVESLRVLKYNDRGDIVANTALPKIFAMPSYCFRITGQASKSNNIWKSYQWMRLSNSEVSFIEGLPIDLINNWEPNNFQEKDMSEVPLGFAFDSTNLALYTINVLKYKQGYLIKFYRLKDKIECLLQMDTFLHFPLIRGFIIEGPNQISFVQSQGDLWKLRFIEFLDSNQSRWESEWKNSFYNQSHSIEYSGGKIIESSFDHGLSKIRILEDLNSSKQNIKSLGLSNLGIESQKLGPGLNSDELEKTGTRKSADSWEFVTYFRPISWKSRFPSKTQRSYSGHFDNQTYSEKYQILNGNIRLGNNDFFFVPYLQNINPILLYNSPISVVIKLSMCNELKTHWVNLFSFSSVSTDRVGIQLNQIKRLKKYTIDQNLIYRSRSYFLNEYALKKDETRWVDIGISRSWSTHCSLKLTGAYFANSNFNRVNNPGFGSFNNTKINCTSLKTTINYSKSGNTFMPFKKWQLELSTSIKVQQFQQKNTHSRNSTTFAIQANFNYPLGPVFVIHSKLIANSSWGALKDQFWVGGSQAWISNKMWADSKIINGINANDLYRYEGGFVRGFLSGTRIGNSSFTIQSEFEINLAQWLINRPIKSQFERCLKLYGFFDLGTAFYGSSPSNPANPFNTILIKSPDFSITVTAKRNPYLFGTGFGISTCIARIPIRYELAWGFSEGRFMSAIQHVCMSWNF